jgi:putative radical SAM enzyme (TIGR03279 family)
MEKRARGGRQGGLVSGAEDGGLAGRMGLQPGDVILAVNDHPLRDVIDFRFHSAEESLEFRIQRGDRELRLFGGREYGERLGVQFAHPTFDVDILRCNNRCEFCFVAQSPRGMRGPLYIKDDDYRFSFLFGHFVTLTNLKDEDWQRIETQHISPLYVSVHATELDLRRQLLGNAGAPDVVEQIRWLGERHIRVHTQLVLIPDVNDGPHLERSLGDLIELFPAVRSISVVPIGLTRTHAPPLRTYRPDEARRLLDQVEPWRERCRRESGLTFVYPSDEWYLLADCPIPPADQYDGFDQIENGVGMVRQFLDEWEGLRCQMSNNKCQVTNDKYQMSDDTYQISNGKYQMSNDKWQIADDEWQMSDDKHQISTCEYQIGNQCCASNGASQVPGIGCGRGTLVCGELAAPVLRSVVEELNALVGSQVSVQPVVNNWYGVVTVSGLLTGRDVVEQLGAAGRNGEASPLGELVLLPRVMFDNSGRMTLDDMTPAQIEEALGVPVAVAQHPDEMLAALRGGLVFDRRDTSDPAGS